MFSHLWRIYLNGTAAREEEAWCLILCGFHLIGEVCMYIHTALKGLPCQTSGFWSLHFSRNLYLCSWSSEEVTQSLKIMSRFTLTSLYSASPLVPTSLGFLSYNSQWQAYGVSHRQFSVVNVPGLVAVFVMIAHSLSLQVIHHSGTGTTKFPAASYFSVSLNLGSHPPLLFSIYSHSLSDLIQFSDIPRPSPLAPISTVPWALDIHTQCLGES